MESGAAGTLRTYRRKERTLVTAVRIDLDTDGFTYRKWGGLQRCKRGDWLVDQQGEVYTVDAQSFARTYRMVSPGVYEKNAIVRAEQAEVAGAIRTKEGFSAYKPGDYLVFNDPNREDGYAVASETFGALYERADDA